MNWKIHFNRGMTIDQFLGTGSDLDKEAYMKMHRKAFSLDGEIVKKVESIKKPVKILAFAEIWCPDCIVNLPVLELMKLKNSNINYRILPRAGNEELLEEYKVDGKARIPTFLLFDEHYKLIGVFIEQPRAVKEIVAGGNQPQIIVTKRAYRRGEYIKHTLQEILQLLKITSFADDECDN